MELQATKSAAIACLLVVLSLAVAALVDAQDIDWITQSGGIGPSNDLATAVDADGNVYVAGRTQGILPGQRSAGYNDAFVCKYDADGNEVWTKQFGTSSGDGAYGISVHAGDIYVAGYTAGTFSGQTSVGRVDAFVRKYDASGNEIWTRQFGTSWEDRASGISVNGAGVYVAGYTVGTLPGQTSAGYYDAFVRKYDPSGDEVWTRQFGSSSEDQALGISVDAGDIYVAGHTAGTFPGQTSTGYVDAFVRKYDASGDEVWTCQFGTSSDDRAHAISVGGGDVYVAGYTGGIFPGQSSTGNHDAFVRKYDVDGNDVWTHQFGTSSSTYARGIIVDAGDVYVAGSAWGALPGQSSTGRYDVFVRKYNAAGADVWTRQFGTAGSDGALGISVDATGVYAAGQRGGDAFVCKHDASGNELWMRQFGAAGPAGDAATSIDADGNIYVAGYTTGILPDQTSAGGDDAFVRKYDADGNEVWTRQFGTSSGDVARAISVHTGHIYVAGQTSGTFPGQTSAGGGDAFVRKYDDSGTELWTRQFGTSLSDWASGISADAGAVYVAGAVRGALPGQTSAGNFDAFVRKYDDSGTELWTRQFGTSSGDQVRGNGVCVDAGDVFVGGYTAGTLPGQMSSGSVDAFVRKYDDSGTELWTRQFGTCSDDRAYGVSVDAGCVYAGGYTSGAFPGQTSAGWSDAFVRKYDRDGTELWTRQFGTSSVDYAYGISAAAGNAYVTGLTHGTFPGQTSAGSYDIFVRKYDGHGNEAWTRQFGTPLELQNYDWACRISADARGVYFAGYTDSTFPGQTSAGGTDILLVKFIDITDSDGDDIEDAIDTEPETYSDDFSDVSIGGTTTGTIVSRGDQYLTIRDEPGTAGVRIMTDPFGGSEKAVISICDGAVTLSLGPGANIVVTCGSVDITVMRGSVDIVFTGADGRIAATTLAEGYSLHFDPICFSIVAPETNPDLVVVVIEGEEFELLPGEIVKGVNMDVKPVSCPNPFNPEAQGVLPVAILGGEEFDVTSVDVSSILLEGVVALRSSLEDVSSPSDGEENICDCSTEWRGPDGHTDLTLKFDTQLIAEALGEVSDGDLVILTLTGELEDGTDIFGQDCVVIRYKGGGQTAALGADARRTFALYQNQPNPAGCNTTIRFFLPVKAYAVLAVYDLCGRKIATLVDGELKPGVHAVTWDSNPPYGTYFYRLVVDDFTGARKMTVLR